MIYSWVRDRVKLCKEISYLSKELKKHKSESYNFFKKAYNEYERKKEVLLILHRQDETGSKIKKIIYEINAIANIIDKEQIDENSISGSLTVYPDSLYK